MNQKWIKLFLRLTISAGFLSAVADRFGFWSKENAAWGNWGSFVAYTGQVTSFLPEKLVGPAAIVATAAEIVFPVFLILGYKTELFAKLSGCLLLLFGLSMTFSIGVKAPLDYSVFTAAVAAFALGTIKTKYLELDSLVK